MKFEVIIEGHMATVKRDQRETLLNLNAIAMHVMETGERLDQAESLGMAKSFQVLSAKVRELQEKVLDLTPLLQCASHQDGDCHHRKCPQIKDGEPAKSGRHCPLDTSSKEI